MSKILFFCIPAQGHTNPTIRVVEELTRRGHQVRYYSFDRFQKQIEEAGATFVSCDPYLPEVTEKEMKRLKKVSTTEMTVQDLETTARIDGMLSRDVEAFRPDCVVSDSVCFWGKLIARKYDLPFVCSTTTFAFNRYSSQYMQNSLSEILDLILGLPRVNRALKKLRPLGYHVDNAMSIVQNDNDTNTIVYTSRQFQPCADTFSDRYTFAGPSVREMEPQKGPRQRRHIYISLGTVLTDRKFYDACIEAMKDLDADVTISVGKETDLSGFGQVPSNIRIYPYVDQMKVLAASDVFVSHCGMNSVSESLYMGVPLVLYPQTGEQKAVAKRTAELGAGVYLTDTTPSGIRKTVEQILQNEVYHAAAAKISRDFRACPGASGAADFIEKVIAGS